MKREVVMIDPEGKEVTPETAQEHVMRVIDKESERLGADVLGVSDGVNVLLGYYRYVGDTTKAFTAGTAFISQGYKVEVRKVKDA